MRLFPATLLACCALPCIAAVAAPADAPAPLWQPVSAARLDASRGGFQLPSGLAVGLGIERTVTINGELVTQTRFAVPDVRLLTTDQAALAQAALASLQLVQNGHATTVTAAPGMGPGATLIQNSLDDQRIQSRTMIDASVNTLNSLKSLNFSASVLDALARTAAPR